MSSGLNEMFLEQVEIATVECVAAKNLSEEKAVETMEIAQALLDGDKERIRRFTSESLAIMDSNFAFAFIVPKVHDREKYRTVFDEPVMQMACITTALRITPVELNQKIQEWVFAETTDYRDRGAYVSFMTQFRMLMKESSHSFSETEA